MKQIKWILPIMVLTLALNSCKEDYHYKYKDGQNFPSADVSFDFRVVGDYARDFYAGANIRFDRSASLIKGTATWNFGDNTEVVTSDADTIMHSFEVAGKYIVTLKIGDKQTTRTIFISDIVPSVTAEFADSATICEVNKTLVQLKVELPNPKNLTEEYEWIFPNGTVDESDAVVQIVTDKTPARIKFNNTVGSARIVLRTKLGGRQLQDCVYNVQVASDKATKNIYYAEKGGNLKMVKLITDAAIENKPFDLGVKSGQHPLNIFFNDSSLYVLDCGKQFTYINDEDTQNMGDGKIAVISHDGKKVETMLTNVGQYAFYDPFYGYLDEKERKLYFSERVLGFSSISLDARNEVMDGAKDKRTNYPYFVQSSNLGYYGKSLTYSSLNSAFCKIGEVWWWAKYNSGSGIYRFKREDIGATSTANPESGLICSGQSIKSFVVDTKRNKLYFVQTENNKFYDVPIDNLEIERMVPDSYAITDLPIKVEGAGVEQVSVSQMVVDEETGKIYFGLCSDDEAKMPSGVYEYNPADKKFNCMVLGTGVYGVAINNNKTKLF